MLFLMLAAVLFALLVGALAFVTGPVGLTMAAAITLWLLLYAARALLRSRSGGPSAGGSGAESPARALVRARSGGPSAGGPAAESSATATATATAPATVSGTALRQFEAVHRV